METVTVFGADGVLGAAVARRVSRSCGLSVKAVDPDGNGQYNAEMKKSGVQVIQCNLNDVKSIKKVISGSKAVFFNTVSNFRNPNFLNKEIAQGRNIADVCSALKIKHVVFCTELHPIRISGIAARHLVAKAEIEEYMRYKGIPLTNLIVPTLYEDLVGILKPEYAGNERLLIIPMGTTPLDMICADDVGEIVRVIINNRSAHINRTHSVSGDKITIKEMAHYLSKHLRPLCFRDKQVTIHEYQEMYSPRPWAQDYANMFDFFLRVDQRYNVDATRRIIPKLTLTGFEEWVAKNSQKLCYAFS
ncbi:hypothetical protein FSP39_023061 [Pinctada imbricata]|uniref:NmrA-like family domain-containing protein 1 n=1 Tax=Pinctada imbricata TaxID=66713 RepID=A0AA88Y3N6_PINIB|nr:hypothetical protein FSP39_023061 [Pinctada imbricata]